MLMMPPSLLLLWLLLSVVFLIFPDMPTDVQRITFMFPTLPFDSSEVFHIPKEDEKSAARVFNMAREDVAGFEEYATRIAAMFRDDPAVLSDLLEGLFHIAAADGTYHPKEEQFLERVATIFGISQRDFTILRARHIPDAIPDPYTVLGVDPDQSLDEIKTEWRRQIRATHPDQMMARGVPQEAIKLAERRLVAINQAWEDISTHRGA